MEIGGRSILQIMVERLKRSRVLDDVVVAVSLDAADDALADHARALGLKCHRGSADDLLGRILEAAREVEADVIVKVFGNYPLVDVGSLDELVEEHLRRSTDFSYNGHRAGVIYGMDVEVASVGVLTDLHQKMSENQRLLNTLYLRQFEDDFNVYRAPSPVVRPLYKVCVNDIWDFKLVSEIFRQVPEPNLETVAAFLDANPLLAEVNQRVYQRREIGLDKIMLFPDKVAAINGGGALDTTYPVSVELSLTNRCNQSCVWCSDAGIRERLPDRLDRDTLRRLFEDLKAGGTRGMVLEGGGEPTLHPSFIDVVRDIRAVGLSVGLITNGIQLYYEDVLDEFEWIRVSLDASTPQEFEALKGGRRFNQVMDHIGVMARARPVVGVGYVVTSRNVSNLEHLVLTLKRMGVDYIHFRPVIDHPEMRADLDLGYLAKYEGPSFSVMLDPLEENAERGNGGKACLAHSLSTVITADGSVYLCGRLNVYDWLPPLGNIVEADFQDIWRGAERRRQADMVRREDFCREFCPECRLTKYNLLFDRMGKVQTVDFI